MRFNQRFPNETVFRTNRLKNGAGQHRAKWPHKAKTPVSKTKTLQICVIARPQRGRGNLKAKGMASRSEAQCPCETDFKHFGNKNGRFYCKTYHFCLIARSAATWQSLSQRHGIPWRSTGAENDRIPKFRIVTERHHSGASPEAPFHAGERLHFPCFSIFPLLKEQILLQSHIRLLEVHFSLRSPAALRSGMPSRSVKDCRVGH